MLDMHSITRIYYVITSVSITKYPYKHGDGCITVDQGEIMMCEPGWINELHYIVSVCSHDKSVTTRRTNSG